MDWRLTLAMEIVEIIRDFKVIIGMKYRKAVIRDLYCKLSAPI